MRTPKAIKYKISFILLTSISFIPVTTYAAGFYIQEQSSTYQGMSFAGAAADPMDASTIYYNPAGMTELSPNQHVNIGTSIIAPYAKLDGSRGAVSGESFFESSNNGGNPYSPTPVPHGFFAAPYSELGQTWLGIGVSAPFGLANEYDSGFWGRYDSTKTSLKVIEVSPSVAFQPYNWLSLGASINIQHADGELVNAVPNPAAAPGVASPSTDGYANLSGDNISAGYGIGILVKPWQDTRVGLTYRSAINHNLTGRLIVQAPAIAGGTITNTPGSVKLKLPDIATLAVSHDVNKKLTVNAHAIFFGWSKFDSIPVDLETGTDPVTLQNYHNTMAYALGARYHLNDDWLVKAGYQFDPTPTKDNFRSTRTPDGDRHWFSTGATYSIKDGLDLDVGLTYIKVMKEDINLTRTFATGAVTMSGTTEANIGIASVGLSYKF